MNKYRQQQIKKRLARRARMLKLREQGWSDTKIGLAEKPVPITRERVAQICGRRKDCGESL